MMSERHFHIPIMIGDDTNFGRVMSTNYSTAHKFKKKLKNILYSL